MAEEKQKKKEKITISRACIVNGEHTPAGTTVELKVMDARLLVASGKAVPRGDDREATIKANAEKAEKDALAKAKAAKKSV